MRWFLRSDFRSFYALNVTQFLGALNDNIFKLIVIYLLINVKGPAFANTILAIAGAVFVVPFLLFSSGAGVLADRYSKRWIIVLAKVLELIVMCFALFCTIYEWEIGLYSALFLMAAQSAFFGPSKYGIIPELVEQKMISKANASMSAFTNLAIIFGTFLASFMTDITDKNFKLESGVCILIALIGLGTSLGIKKTEPRRSEKKVNPFFLYEIYQTLKMSWKIPHLLPSIFGSSYFLFIGAYTQLNIIPFGIESLHLSEVGGGYLFLATAVGIAIGAVLAGQLSKDHVEPGISCIAGFFIAVLAILLWVFSSSLIVTLLLLALLGVFGGAFLIPFDSFLQVNSPDKKRGQVIAAGNFLSFLGVLVAAFALYFLSEKLGLTAAQGFAVIGVITFVTNIILSGRLSELFFPFFIKKILKKFRQLSLLSPKPNPSEIIVLQSNSWWDAILLFSYLPRLKILLPDPYFRRFPWFNGLIDSFKIVPPDLQSVTTLKKLFRQAKKLQTKNNSICLFFHKREDRDEIVRAYREVFGKFRYDIVYAHGKKEKTLKRWFGIPYYLKEIRMTFSKEP